MLIHPFFIILLSIIFIPGLQALKQDPLAELDLLIVSTEDLSLKQKTVRSALTEYIYLRDIYLKDMENREILLKTAIFARSALKTIKEEKLTPLFEPDFISEMTLFAKLAANPTLPKPQ